MLKNHTGLYTDLYELSMAQGYFLSGREKETACFDYFFRKAPFGGSYVVFAGLRNLLEFLEDFEYNRKDLDYLHSLGFQDSFLDYLSTFWFKGNIYAPEEGDLVFPFEPVMRIEGSLIETQLIETLLLNIINFESLIATKSSRIRQAAGNKTIAEFGLRRAQGFGATQASRAAIIGGADSTSNVYAAYHYNCEASGTQAHSWIQSFEDELTAFRAYAETFPDNCILLVDTYNTLKSGVPNAIRVAGELKDKGHKLAGIRLDSGDLLQLSREARRMLDNAGFEDVKIIASNQIDEAVIEDVLSKEAPIDAFGVGTSLATGSPDGALDGIYKLSACNGIPKLKLSETKEKISLPGYKKVFRFENEQGEFIGDGVFLEEESGSEELMFENEILNLHAYKKSLLQVHCMTNGRFNLLNKSIQEIRSYAQEQIAKLPLKHRSLKKAVPYKVGFSKELLELQMKIIKEIKSHKSILK